MSKKASTFTQIILVLVLIIGFGVLVKASWDHFQKEEVAKQSSVLSQEVDDIINDSDIDFGSNISDPIKTKEVSKEIIKASNKKYDSNNIDAFLDIGDGFIREPVIKSPDQFYLRHLPNGKYALAGTVFTWGEQFSPDESYAVYYGHAMKNGSRFGPLVDNKKNPKKFKKGTVFTEESGVRNLELVQFSEITIEDFEFEKLTSFNDVKHYMANINNVGDVLYQSNIDLTEDDFVVSLSTCAVLGGATRLVAIYREV